MRDRAHDKWRYIDDHADRLWLAAAVGLLAADVVLVVHGQRTLTDVAREHRGAALFGLALVAAHILDILGPVDPFRIYGVVERVAVIMGHGR